jgi:hypothetical protein
MTNLSTYLLAGLFFFILSIMVTKGCESNEVATFSPNRPFALIFAYHFPKTKGVYRLLSWAR